MSTLAWIGVGIALGIAVACTVIGVICCMFSSRVTRQTEKQRGRLE
jgi:hypothetical protein